MRTLNIIVCMLTVAVVAPVNAEVAKRAAARITGPTMGTRYSVTLPLAPSEVANERLRAEIDSLLLTIDERMSTYRDDSEIARFNESASTEWHPVSPDTFEVVAEARRIGFASDGALDVTAAPLIELWGFGAAGGADGAPSAHAVDRASRLVGLSKLVARAEEPALRKTLPEVRVDLSAVAKGFAVDRIASYLEERGIDSYLVEIGGELRARGRGPTGAPWRVAIQHATGEPLAAQAVLELADGAVATSGDYRDYFEHDGGRYSHIIDPRTGHPVRHRLASVTVVERTAMRADGYATALLVLGPVEGLRVARERGLAALFVVRDGDELRPLGTPQLERYRIR